MIIIEWIKDNYEVIVALSALLVGLYGVWATRQHNKMSVRPFLRGHWKTQRSDERFELIYDIENDGIGPAFVNHFDFEHDGSRLDINTSEDIEQFFANAKARNPAFANFEVIEAGYGHSMKEGDSLRVLKVACPASDAAVLSGFIGLFTISIHYKSIYGERLYFTTDDLTRRRNIGITERP